MRVPPGAAPASSAAADSPAVKAPAGWPGSASDTASVSALCSVIDTVSPSLTTSTGPGAVAEPASPVLEKPQMGIDLPSTDVVPVIA